MLTTCINFLTFGRIQSDWFGINNKQSSTIYYTFQTDTKIDNGVVWLMLQTLTLHQKY